MFVYDKYRSAINVDQIMGLFVHADPDNEGAYEVQANDADNNLIAQFSVDAPMTEDQANALMVRMVTSFGILDLTQ